MNWIKKILGLKTEKQCAIHNVSSSKVIEPINCELSDGMKAHIEMFELSNKLFDEARKQLIIPKELLGSM